MAPTLNGETYTGCGGSSPAKRLVLSAMESSLPLLNLPAEINRRWLITCLIVPGAVISKRYATARHRVTVSKTE